MTGEGPFADAAAVYDREPCARPFVEDFEAHLRYGWVISTPSLFLMARPVRSDWPEDVVLNPFALPDSPDMWHVWLAAGDWREAFDCAPYPLPWVSFERNNRLRRYAWSAIFRRSRALSSAPEGREADATTATTTAGTTAF